MWTAAFALGAFVGPTAAGALYDLVGFRWSTLFTVGCNGAVCLAATAKLAAAGCSSVRAARHRALYQVNIE